MIKNKHKKESRDGLKIQGFFKLQITENGKVVGETGWRKNQVTNLGIQNYVVTPLLGGAAMSVAFMNLGTGGAPIATDTTLAGEITHSTNARKTVSTSVVSSKTAQFTAAFNSSDSFVTATANISNVGLFFTSATNAGTLFAGNTFVSSAVATNQNVNVTYQIRFS